MRRVNAACAGAGSSTSRETGDVLRADRSWRGEQDLPGGRGADGLREKIQDEDTWKIYRRAYKKYYARVMKGNMSREDFNAWAAQAAADRDAAIEQITPKVDAALKAQIVEQLREKLNRQ